MKSILVSSSERHSGKSAFCLGLALKLKDEGINVGYLKPIGIKIKTVDKFLVDEDAESIKEAMGSKYPANMLSPIVITDELCQKFLSGKSEDLEKKLIDAFKTVSKDKELMVLEGTADMNGGAMFGLSDPRIAELTDSKIVIMCRYDSIYVINKVLSYVELIEHHEKKINKNLLAGIILSEVPEKDVKAIKSTISKFLKPRGVEVLGALPRDKILNSVSVGELAEELNGDLLTATGEKDRLIESFLVGAMSPYHAIKYFRRNVNTAVITGGDRSDIQSAALETHIDCLILTGGLTPTAPIMARADEMNVPIILVGYDTLTTVQRTHSILEKVQIKGKTKIGRVKKIISENVDFDKLKKFIE